MPLYFHNSGVIDIRGATIAGLSAKDGETPIGKFGTGLKYGIACVLRWGGSITICAGGDEYQFGAVELDFRGKIFSQVVLHHNGQPGQQLGFTTEYGKEWEPWQVYREFYANALDEGGSVSDVPVTCGPDRTVIRIACPLLEAEHTSRDTIILPSTRQPIHSSPSAQLFEGKAEYLYYRGVRVAKHSTSCTYNIIAEQKLTEDRTLLDGWRYRYYAARALQACDNPSLIEAALSTASGTFESLITFDETDTTSPAFLDTAARLYRQSPRKHRRLKEILQALRPEAAEEIVVELSPMRQRMLEKAIALVARMGIPDAAEHPVTVAELGGDTLGECRNGKIYLDPKVFDQGTKQVVSTLFEEHIHRTTGYSDCTYTMQTHLFNLICSLYEEHVFQEPM